MLKQRRGEKTGGGKKRRRRTRRRRKRGKERGRGGGGGEVSHEKRYGISEDETLGLVWASAISSRTPL